MRGPAPRFLYLEGPIYISSGQVKNMNPHLGVYIGKEVKCSDIDEEVCNIVECTSSWGGGIKLSYFDNTWKRYIKKGGTEEYKWPKNGEPSNWFQYS